MKYITLTAVLIACSLIHGEDGVTDTLILSVNGEEMVVDFGEKVTLDGDIVPIRLGPKMVSLGSLSFTFNGDFAFNADDDEIKSFTFDGDDLVITVFQFEVGPDNLADLKNSLLKEFKNIGMSAVETEGRIEKFKSILVKIDIGEIKLNYDLFLVGSVDGYDYIVTLQDTVEDFGDSSVEYIRFTKEFFESFKVRNP